jgi:hypothetical protein
LRPEPESVHALIEPSALRAALTRNGSIKVWGNPNSGGENAPDGKGYTKIYSTSSAFAYNPYHGGLFCLQNVDYPTP